MPKNLYLQHFKNIEDNAFSAKLLEKYHDLTNKIKAKALPMIDIIFNENDIAEFQTLANIAKKYKKVLVLGVGGSSLGGKTLTSLNYQNKLQFLESIDPETVKNTLDEIDLKNTFFLVVSKSGETIETICQTLILLDKLKTENIEDFAKQFLFITESETNSIAKIAKKISAKIYPHPNNIGGRFSCFCVVGLLPALICDIDAKKIREGAKKILEHFLNENDNYVLKSCQSQIDLYESGFDSNVVMPYIDVLKNFTDWYRQLWAESLGKNQFGSTPINSMGTIDQHSQLQLYLEGPKNKFFTFFTLKKFKNDFDIKDIETCKTLFGAKRLSQIVEVEQNTTIETLNQKKLPIRIFAIEKLDEETLGGFMMQMFLETILMASYQEINPFDQPAVEIRKNMAKEILQNL